MKSINRKYTKIFVAFACLLSLFSNRSAAQEETLINPYIQLQYFKDNDNNSSLKTTLSYSKNRMELPLPGIKVAFYSVAGKKELLSSATTDENGVATFPFPKGIKIPADGEGLWSFTTGFDGNDTINAATAELAIKDVNLEMTVSEADSIKTITLGATTVEKGRPVPVAGEVIMIYVPRMFSNLLVAEATLDDAGLVTVEFPSDMPGDTLGNLKIIARFEENPTFGNVERTSIQQWGIPTSYSIPTTHRALWTKTAPKWMIFTLTILLAAVWGHYMFAVISLILIKIDANKKKAKEEYKL